MKNIYIIGAGLAGLSASVHAVKRNYKVNVFESSNLIGGRCRSFFDKKIGQEIDNGNHLVFTANKNFYELCKIVKSLNSLQLLPFDLDFYDKKQSIYWNINLEKINLFKIIRNNLELIPGTNLLDYLSIFKFFFAKENSTVHQIIGNSKIYSTFWDPLTLAVMNTSSENASAKILAFVLKETILKGKKNCSIYQPKVNWNDSVIKPCTNFLKKQGCEINLKNILKSIKINNNLITKLEFINNSVEVKENDLVIFAIPPSNFSKFFPNLSLPKNYNSIVNVHFKLTKTIKENFSKKIIGFINSHTHWLFIKKNYLSVTISNANHLNNLDSNEIANIIWKELCSYMKIKHRITSFQVVKEKKATLEQSPTNFNLVRKLKEIPNNVRISGDWTQTTHPCTIEGSILSGKRAILQ